MAKKPAKKNDQPQDPMGNRPNYVSEQDYDMPEQESSFYPRIKVMQALSPELDDTNEKFIPGASTGQILVETNPPTLVESIDVIPLIVKKRYAEFTPRKQGGGFVASYDSREEMEAGFSPGNDMQVVIEYLVLAIELEQVFVVPFQSATALGVAKKWGNFVEQYKTLNGVMYKISSKTAKNKASQSYKVMTVEPIGWTAKQLFHDTEALMGQEEMKFLSAPEEEESEV